MSETSPLKTPNLYNNFNLKLCAVCGDNAVGTNFGVTSCESCKAFFRRNNIRKTTIICPFQGNCIINIYSRKNCQACRLQKCINVGMKKDIISKEQQSKKILKDDECRDIKITRQRRSDMSYTITKKAKVSGSKNESIDVTKLDSIELPKNDYIKLVNKINELEDQLYQRQVDECKCTCKCGFYPINTKFSNILKLETSKVTEKLSKTTTFDEMKKVHNEDSEKTIINGDYLKNNITSSGTNTIKPSQVDYYRNVIFTKANNIYDNDTSRIIDNIHLPLPYLNTSNVENFVSKSMTSGSNQVQQFSFNNVPKSNLPVTPFAPELFPNPLQLDSQPSSILGNEPYYYDTCFRRALPYISPPPSILSCGNSTPNMAGYFENWEMELLSELIKSNVIMKEPINVKPASGSSDFSLQDIVEFTNLAFRRTIQMSKMISLFKQLNENDQMTLVKGGASEILILRGAMVYDPTKGSWKHYAYQGATDIMIKIDVLKNSSEQSYYLKHKMFLESFNERWRKSEEVMLLLNVIILFNPSRLNIQNVSGISAANFVYKHILKKFIVYQCSNEEEAQMEFDNLMNKLNELEELNKGLISIYSLLTINDLDPLLIELFDLK